MYNVPCMCVVLQSGEGEVREETDGGEGSEAGPPRKKRWWQTSGDKKPQKFGWIMGVLVSQRATK